MARIGIMGGTFDPIHKGHLLIGRQAKTEYNLSQIWYMPSGQPPHKRDHRVSEADTRCDMVKLALAHEDGLIFSDFEIRRPGNTYTAQTLALLQEAYPEHEFYFILGADSLYEIEQWYHPEQIMANTAILAACREYDPDHPSLAQQIQYLTRKYQARIYQLHSPEMDVSSEEIRRLTGEGKSAEAYVPRAVWEYICEHGLYQDSNSDGGASCPSAPGIEGMEA